MIYEMKTDRTIPRFCQTDGLVFSRTVAVRTGDPMDLQMILVGDSMLSGEEKKEKRPCILYLAGGAWLGCFRTKDIPSLMYFARRGYILASIDYRCSPQASWPAQMTDVQTAIRFLRANAGCLGIDEKRIAVMGVSAGGHLTSMAAMNLDSYPKAEWSEYSAEVCCAVSLFGPSSLEHIVEDREAAGMPNNGPGPMAAAPGGKPPKRPDFLPPMGPRPAMDLGPDGQPLQPEEMLIGGPMTEKLDVARDASPVAQINDKTCPILLLHGDADPVVPYNQSVRLHDALNAAGKETDLYCVKGAGHGDPLFFQDEVLEKICAFLDKYMK